MLLIAEDDSVIAQIYSIAIPDSTIARDGSEAIELLEGKYFSLIILDLLMPNKTGYDVLDYMQENNISTPVVVCTNYETASSKGLAKYNNVKEVIIKAKTGIGDLKEIIQKYIA